VRPVALAGLDTIVLFSQNIQETSLNMIVFCSYIKGSFALDILGCFPWDFIYKVIEIDISINSCNCDCHCASEIWD